MPSLTIIIPTHNRQKYCAFVVKCINEIMPDAEIIISDTSVEDNLRSLLGDLLLLPNIKYFRPGMMDVVSHFEFAFGHATGDYLMSLGDDDLIGPRLREVVEWAKRESVDAVVSYGTRLLAWYYWPGIKSKYYGSLYSERMFVAHMDGGAAKLDTSAAIRHVLKNFGRNPGEMPKAYHGLVSRDLVSRVREKYGSLFGGVSPDIYSCTLLAREARNAWVVEYPFCLPGASPSSTAGTGVAQIDVSDLKLNPHTKLFKDLVWDPLIPEFYCVFTVWSYSFLKALQKVNDPSLQPNFARLYVCCFLYERGHWNATAAAFRRWVDQVGALKATWEVVGAVMQELAFQGKRYGKRLINPRPGGQADSIRHLKDIGEAYHALAAHLDRKGIVPVLPKLR